VGAVFGYINIEGSPLGEDRLETMSATLKHRGPQHAKTWSKDGIGLGFRSLPFEPFFQKDMEAHDGSGILHAFDGYLSNTEALHSANGSTSEKHDFGMLLTDLYMKQGPQYCAALHGPYSSAILDRQNNRVVLARNITGQRTLFYTKTDAFFAFASEIKALVKLPGVSTEMDEESLYWYLASAYVPHPRTIYKEIHQLAPGASLVYDLQTHTIQLVEANMRKGRVPVPTEGWSEEDYIDELDKRLTRAVEKQVAHLSEPIGCFVTGGLDTALVLSLLKKVTTKKLSTFVVGFGDKNCDERPHAKAIADHLGVEHHSHLFTEQDFLDLTFKLFDVHDEPFSDLGAGTAFFGTALAKQHSDVTFTGAASDFLFGNFDLAYVYKYYKHMPWPFRKAFMSTSRKLFESPQLQDKFPNMPLMTYLGGRSFFETFFTKWSSTEIQALLGMSVDVKEGNFYRTFMDLKGVPLSGRIQKSLYSTYSTDCVDREFERSCMAHSLHTVNPYLDADVFQFANQLPDSMKFRKRYGKYINRRLLYDRYIPQTLFTKPKRGTSLPIDANNNRAMTQLIDEYLNVDRLRREGIFHDLSVVQKAIEAFRSGQPFQGHKLWTLIVFQIWRERALALK